jgi:hypothetical protein
MIHVFPNLFPILFLQKVWESLENFFGKSLEKSLETGLTLQERTPKEHSSSATIYPTLSELCFRADVRRYDHVAGYEDDNIKKSKANPIFCWA